MTKDEFEAALEHAGEIQRKAGWSEASIASYAAEQRAITGDNYGCILIVGAGLACDNTRHGVPAFEAVDPDTCPLCEFPFFVKRCTRCGYEEVPT